MPGCWGGPVLQLPASACREPHLVAVPGHDEEQCPAVPLRSVIPEVAVSLSQRLVDPSSLLSARIIFSTDDNWKVMRRFTLSTLRDYGMGRRVLEDKIKEECDYLVDRLRSYKGKPFDNIKTLTPALANIILSITLGQRYDYEDPTILRIMHLARENTLLAGHPMALMYNTFPNLMVWVPGSHQQFFKNSVEVMSFITETCRKQKKRLDVNNPTSLIETFLAKQEEENSNQESYFHDKNLKKLVADLLGAGMETTTTTLRWALLMMMKYPEIQKNVQNEIEKVIGIAQPKASTGNKCRTPTLSFMKCKGLVMSCRVICRIPPPET
uniref:Cytochrome P450 n=1 Tax=Leptobrachium leishanense TaxID=445787 RepID=A0A8C5MAV1_9ANUR